MNEPIPSTGVFTDPVSGGIRPGVKLRAWMSVDGGGLVRLEPDIEFASVPYAMTAGFAQTVRNRSVGETQIIEGAVTGSLLAEDSVSSASIMDGAVRPEKIEPGWGVVPAGTVITYGIPGPAVPDGYVECDGGTVAASAHPRLAALLGTGASSVYGPVAEGLVKLPDFRGRVPIGAGQGTGLSLRIPAQMIGAETHTLTIAEMPEHNHNIHDPGHSHGVNAGGGGGSGLVLVADNRGGGPLGVPNWGVVGNTTGITILNRGGNAPHNIMQPSLVVRFLMKD